jgi:ADP-ribose pyrophosphatase YjhB (NUDIX family)
MSYPFNVRAYGVLIHRGAVLVSDENYENLSFTKLPGGGLEFGEGLTQCLVREFKEETALDIEVGEHLYTTDFFQRSAFNRSHQVISVYYRVFALQPIGLLTPEPQEQGQSFRWVDLQNLTDEVFTFPIEKRLVPILRELD